MARIKGGLQRRIVQGQQHVTSTRGGLHKLPHTPDSRLRTGKAGVWPNQWSTSMRPRKAPRQADSAARPRLRFTALAPWPLRRRTSWQPDRRDTRCLEWTSSHPYLVCMSQGTCQRRNQRKKIDEDKLVRMDYSPKRVGATHTRGLAVVTLAIFFKINKGNCSALSACIPSSRMLVYDSKYDKSPR